MGTTVLLNLAGGIALLLSGLHMVQSGILRAFGADLRRMLATALRNRFTALCAGVGAMTDDRKLVSSIERMDNAVDKLHEAIKPYVTKLTRESLDDREAMRAMEIVAFAINLEHIGDIIDKGARREENQKAV
jgi:Na+/phosphate symporter